MPWPPESAAAKKAVLERQRIAAPALQFLATFARPMPPEEPVTDAEKEQLRRQRDAALAFIESFKGKGA